MELRELINRRAGLVASMIIALAAIAVGISLYSTRQKAWPKPITQAFFSDDDGKTYFADEIAKPSPFDHGGKPAFRVYVYKCSNSSSPFVGYLSRQASDEKPEGPLGSTADAVKAGATRGKASDGMEVKKPGDPNWVPLASPQGNAISDVTCPDGERPLAVLPGG